MAEHKSYKCDVCGNPATVHITKIINGKKIVRHLCSDHAAQEGFFPSTGGLTSFEDFGFPGLFEFPDIFASLFKRRPSERFYDYFSDEAQRVIQLASEEAKRLGHDHVRTEHILLGLIKQEGLASKVLQKMEVDLVNLFSDIESLIGRGEGSPDKIVLSPRAKKVLELAYNAARELGFNYVGPEHMLLGVIREGESLSAQALHKRKITFDKVAKEIISEVEKALGPEIGGVPEEDFDEDFPVEEIEGGMGGGMGGPEAMFGFPGIGIGAPPRQKKPALTSFGKDLTALAKEGKLDPVIGRQKEIDRVMRILSRRTKNNPALLGDPGVGKTAIVEGLAARIVKGEVPDTIKDKQIISLDLGGMVAGTKYRGEFEQRVKKVLDEILKQKRKIILFIDELHTLVGAGGAEGAIDAANMLKPALARGELQVIGATTLDEYRKHIEKDMALERRFQPVMVSEPTVEETIEILKGIRDRYEEHHNVKIPDAALIAAASLSHRYISDRFLPDKAIDVMDEAGAKVRMRLFSPAKNIQSLKLAIEKITREKEAALTSSKYEEAATLRDKIEQAEKKLKELEGKHKLETEKGDAMVTEEDIAEIVSDWTGIPVVKLTAAETEKLVRMEEELHKRVIGQNDAITAISQAVRRGRAGLKPPQRPIGSFIFAGPTGVGKTEVARRLAEFMFGTNDALIHMDMSEFMEKHTVSRLIGAPPGYVGFDEGGKLTEAVRRKPYSILLFDEIEKAHPDVFNILLQVLEDGKLTDSKGHAVDFKNCIIIMTSNIGQKMIVDQGPIGFMAREDQETNYDNMKETINEAMKREFRPEFLNRIDEVIIFHPLSDEELKKIAGLIVGDVQKQMKGQEMELEITEAAEAVIVKEGYEPKFGARPLRRAVQRLIENPLSNNIIEGKFKKGDKVKADAKEGKIFFAKIGGAQLKTEEKPKQKKKNRKKK
ncbi:MAG: AAA family ATPase [bacterium]